MKKNTKSMPMEAKMPEPSMTIRMKKEQADGVSMGDMVDCGVSGKVKGMRESYDDKNIVEMELSGSKVRSVKTNRADKDMKRMMEE